MYLGLRIQFTELLSLPEHSENVEEIWSWNKIASFSRPGRSVIAELFSPFIFYIRIGDESPPPFTLYSEVLKTWFLANYRCYSTFGAKCNLEIVVRAGEVA